MPAFDEDYDPGFDPGAPAPPPNVPPPAGNIGPVGPIAKAPGVPGAPDAPPGGAGGQGGGYVPAGMPGLPGFNIPGAPAFNAPKFTAPDQNALLSDPGYLARLSTANRALEHSAAAAGRLRTGGTLNDIVEQSQNFGAQEYDNAYRRARDTFDTTYRGAYDAYAPQLAAWKLRAEGLGGMQRDRYSAELNNWLTQSAPRGGGGGGGYYDIPEDPGPPPGLPPAGAPPAGGGGNWWDPYTKPTGPYSK